VSTDVHGAIEHLTAFGYCVLEQRIPAELATQLGERLLELHADAAYAPYIVGDRYYQTLFGVLNYDDRVALCASHPDVVAVARHFLGPHCRVVEACSKPTWPGAPAQGLHVDSAGEFLHVPDVPWLINSMWMLTDFTVENGATGVVPMSHLSRRHAPPADLTPDSPLVRPVTGARGSVLLWHGGLFHVARANRSDAIRVGLNIAYNPRWMNNWIEGGHQPIWPETYQRMPPQMQALCPPRRGRTRAEVYEQPD
jgi:ectoine hydroxylase-related dioxygenase (phytanoyl-CoA dioxygenase family)